MPDAYWQRLVSTHVELSAPDHALNTYPDPQLERTLTEPHPEEATYEAPAVSTRDVTITHGAGSFGVRIYTPDDASNNRPLFVWCHGGAWAAGDLEGPEGDATAREVASRAGAVVVSVDYRLATQGTHYPVPLDDVVAAYKWALDNASLLGADPARITLGGASAGGNLAAGAALWLRDNAQPLPVSLALAYPTLHPRMPEPTDELKSKLARMSPTASAVPEVFDIIIENYVGDALENTPAYAMPGLAQDLGRLPETYIFNDEFDGLRASGEHFAHQLAAAGNTVVLETLPGVGHGHLARPGLPQSRQSHADLAAWVRDRTVPASAQLLSA